MPLNLLLVSVVVYIAFRCLFRSIRFVTVVVHCIGLTRPFARNCNNANKTSWRAAILRERKCNFEGKHRDYIVVGRLCLTSDVWYCPINSIVMMPCGEADEVNQSPPHADQRVTSSTASTVNRCGSCSMLQRGLCVNALKFRYYAFMCASTVCAV